MTLKAALGGVPRLLLLALCSLAAAPAHAAPGPLHVEDGRLRDDHGRDAMLRGVNLDVGLRRPGVVDEPPFPIELHARKIAELGFNVVRLQLTWGAIEPGTAGPNDPAICAEGPPSDPGQWDEQHAQAYLDRVQRTVDALAQHGIYTIIQIAQYGYSERFGGPPSHPDWAVCTSGIPITSRGNPYLQPGTSRASEHFFQNDVRGDLQGEYIRMLRAIAARFADNPWIAGEEIYNEPFSPRALDPRGGFDALVQCFYAGSADPGRLADGSRPQCPPGSHPQGAIPQMRREDPDLVIHAQPHIFTNFAIPTHMGPLPFGNLAFNFHVYCPSSVGFRAIVPGGQTEGGRGPECDHAEETALEEAKGTRNAMRGAAQPGGLEWFLSEFGFTDNEQELRHMTELADRHLLGWAYFKWRGQEDAAPGDLADPDGNLRPFAHILVRPYPAALAGTATAMSYAPDSRMFELHYAPRHDRTTRSAAERSVVILPRLAYPDGACPTTEDATWRIDGDRLLLTARPGVESVDLRVRPGPCPSAATAPGGESEENTQPAKPPSGGRRDDSHRAAPAAGRASAAGTTGTGALPFTGLALASLAVVGLVLVLSGAGLRRRTARRQ